MAMEVPYEETASQSPIALTRPCIGAMAARGGMLVFILMLNMYCLRGRTQGASSRRFRPR